MRSLLVILGLGALASVALAAAAPSIIGVSAIHPGMKGYGLTVFRGTKPERFDVEVIDVLNNFEPDQDLILIRTPHPVLDKAMVVGGMSGSPIFLDGKLAGAYAYGWLFAKEPIAGVTPIANMLAEMARPIDPGLWKALGTLPTLARRDASPRTRATASTARLAGLPPYLGDGPYDAFTAMRQHATRADRATGTDARFTRAVTPIMVAGLGERVIAALGDDLERFGMVALQAGGGQRKPAPAGPAAFEDGGAIGVQLIRGDIQATAIGTVTHVAGDRLVAFGHPMMQAGQIALPTATARVLHVLSNERRSFKIAETVAPLGALVNDRQAAIVVDTRLAAETVPVRIHVVGVPGAPRPEWNVEIASHRMLTPMLAFAAILNAVDVTTADQTDVVFEATTRAQVEGHGTVTLTDFGYSGFGAGSPMALSQLRLFRVLGAAYGNPFEDTRIRRIDVELKLRFAHDVVEIVDAMMPAPEVDPGKDARVYVTLRPFGGDDEVRAVDIPIPWSAAGQSVEVSFEAGSAVQLDQPVPDDLEQILDNVRAGFAATSMVASVKLPSRGLKLRGHVAQDLPGSALDMLQLEGEASRPASFITQRRQEIALGSVVSGSTKVKFNVREEPIR